MTVRRYRYGVPLTRSVAAFMILAGGCDGGGAATKASLVSVATIAPGVMCQYGGVTLTSGLDTNTSGVLDADEVTSTSNVCNGPQADSEVVVTTSMLAFGSALCATGGTQIDSGLDNGNGGGTAGNGTLESGEIDATAAICNGQAAGSFDLARPGGAGTAHINLSGGARTGGFGFPGPSGAGGTLTLGAGDSPGSYAVFDTGTADTTHTIPSLAVSMGADGETIAVNTTITEFVAMPVDDAIYIDTTAIPARLVRYHAAPSPRYTAITGLRVNANVTLTIAQPTPVKPFFVGGDLDVQGTIVTAVIAASANRGALSISGRNVLIGQSGGINLSPTAGTGGAPGALSLGAAGTLVNAGTLSTAPTYHIGAVALPGAQLGVSATSLYNTGAIVTAANVALNAGAAGGDVLLTASRALVNAGSITTSGGSGNSGGKAGNVSIALATSTQQLANDTLISAGAITAVGGTCVTNGQVAGAGGVVTITAVGARIRHNAAILASGGTPRLASGIVTAGDCASGAGGAITIDASSDDAGWDPVSMVDVSGALDASGPAGVRGGGKGGAITLQVDRPQGGLVRLLGYAAIDINAGSFGDAGTAAGSIVHATTIASASGVFASFVPEQIHIYAAINATGGGAVVAGAGGVINLQHTIDGAIANVSSSSSPSLILAGAIDARGGDGGTSRGAGGVLTYHGFGDAELRGTILLDGGSSSVANPTNPGSLAINTTGTLSVTAAISANGTDQGILVPTSRGGSVSLAASHVDVNANVSARGGNATSQRPGDGGSIFVLSRNAPSVITGALDVAAGTGATGTATNFDAVAGTIVVDGLGI